MTDFLLDSVSIAFPMSVVIALLLLAFRIAGHGLSAKCRHAVWLIVILRLCTPFGIQSLPTLFEVAIPQAAVTVSEPQDAVPTVTVPQNLPDTVYSYDTSASVAASMPVEGPAHKLLSPLELAAWVYICGMIVFAAYKTFMYAVFAYGMKRSLYAPDGALKELYSDLSAKLGIKRAPKLCIGKVADSPMLYGLIYHRVVLPESVADLLKTALTEILTHELTHYKRRDLWIKLAAEVAVAVNWYNPLVHIAATRLSRECELACDECTLDGLDEKSRSEYGSVMLGIIKRCKKNSNTLTTRFNPKKNAVKERFTNIMDMTKKKRGIWIIALAVILCAATGIIIGCNTKVSDNPSFEVVMMESYMTTDSIKLTVFLPDSGSSDDIVFDINGIEYTVAKFLTSDNTVFYFADREDDGMNSVALIIPQDAAGVVELHMRPEDGNELVFMSETAAFTKLLNFIGFNASADIAVDKLENVRYNVNIDSKHGITADFILPEGFSLTDYNAAPIAEGISANMYGAGLNSITCNGEIVGGIDFNDYTVYPDTPEDRYFHMVYSGFMNSTMCDWDGGYTPVSDNGTTHTATDRVRWSIPSDGGKVRDEFTIPTILAYDDATLKYVVIYFNRDYDISDADLRSIAESVEIISSEPATIAEPASPTDENATIFMKTQNGEMSYEELFTYPEAQNVIVAQVNEILNDYNNGTLPNPIENYYESEPFRVSLIPDGVKLPKKIGWDDLEIYIGTIVFPDKPILPVYDDMYPCHIVLPLGGHWNLCVDAVVTSFERPENSTMQLYDLSFYYGNLYDKDDLRTYGFTEPYIHNTALESAVSSVLRNKYAGEAYTADNQNRGMNFMQLYYKFLLNDGRYMTLTFDIRRENGIESYVFVKADEFDTVSASPYDIFVRYGIWIISPFQYLTDSQRSQIDTELETATGLVNIPTFSELLDGGRVIEGGTLSMRIGFDDSEGRKVEARFVRFTASGEDISELTIKESDTWDDLPWKCVSCTIDGRSASEPVPEEEVVPEPITPDEKFAEILPAHLLEYTDGSALDAEVKATLDAAFTLKYNFDSFDFPKTGDKAIEETGNIETYWLLDTSVIPDVKTYADKFYTAFSLGYMSQYEPDFETWLTSGNMPYFKTVGGKLLVLDSYKGVPVRFYGSEAVITAASGDTVTAAVPGIDIGGGYYTCAVTLVREDGVLKIDRISDYKNIY